MTSNTWLRSGFLIALVLWAGPHSMSGQKPVGTARVSGVVLTAEAAPRPVRRAIVSLRGSDLELGHHAITDDDGRFEINELPAGRFDLSARRPAFVTIAYGASRPEWPGTPLAIAAGEHLSGVTVRLAPGAVITGTVRDETGAPVADLAVRVERRTAAGQLVERVIQTDPQGIYRFYELAPGAYTVSVQPLRMAREVMHARSDAEVDAILQQLQQGRYATQGAPMDRPSNTAAVSDFAPIYYPSAFTSEDASPVSVAAGEERGGVDLTIRLMSTSRLVGRVVRSDGRAATGGSVNLVRASRYPGRSSSAPVRADGTFEFSTVTPGRYQTVTWSAPSVGEATAPCEFAASAIDVTGGEPPEVVLTLKPCLKITGRVEVASDATPPAAPASLVGVPVRFEADRSTGAPMDVLLPIIATIGADRTFRTGGALHLVPGSYIVTAGTSGNVPGTGWVVQSATVDGEDVLDMPLTLTYGSPEVTNVLLTFTNRHTSLSGTLMTAGGRPAIEYTVIAFTTNRGWWRSPFRRVLARRPATDGAFVLRDLPPGEYFLAALADTAPNEWLDAVFLEKAARQAVTVTVGPGENKIQSLQIRGDR